MKYNFLSFILIACIFSFTSCKGQEPFGENYLKLIKKIPLQNVKGRIDHLDINLKEQIIYVAALGNNSVEAVDLKNGKVIHSITGLDEPQGVCYIPQHNEIFVANGGNGNCYFYNNIFQKVATVHLNSDADDVRYDSAEKKIYVGYGSGGIAIINADTHKQIGDIKLPSHPEGFQIDKKNNLLYVNLPSAGGIIGVADLKKLKLVNTWSKNYRRGNFPMALDAAGGKLFIGYRHPAKLAVIDIRTGARICVSDLTNDSDDLFYDDVLKRVYISCGGGYSEPGYINIFQEESVKNYKQIANIPARNGTRTSLLVPRLNLFLVAEPSVYTHDAELMVYKIQK